MIPPFFAWVPLGILLAALAFIVITGWAVTAGVLLDRQAARYEVQLEALRSSVWREAAGRQDAEAHVRWLLGEDPESTALDEWEQAEIDRLEAFYADTAADPEVTP